MSFFYGSESPVVTTPLPEPLETFSKDALSDFKACGRIIADLGCSVASDKYHELTSSNPAQKSVYRDFCELRIELIKMKYSHMEVAAKLYLSVEKLREKEAKTKLVMSPR